MGLTAFIALVILNVCSALCVTRLHRAYTYSLTVFSLLVVSHQVFNRLVELIVLVMVQGQDELLMMQSIQYPVDNKKCAHCSL